MALRGGGSAKGSDVLVASGGVFPRPSPGRELGSMSFHGEERRQVVAGVSWKCIWPQISGHLASELDTNRDE